MRPPGVLLILRAIITLPASLPCMRMSSSLIATSPASPGLLSRWDTLVSRLPRAFPLSRRSSTVPPILPRDTRPLPPSTAASHISLQMKVGSSYRMEINLRAKMTQNEQSLTSALLQVRLRCREMILYRIRSNLSISFAMALRGTYMKQNIGKISISRNIDLKN